MKNKFLILFVGFISFLGISEAKATTYNVNTVYVDSNTNVTVENQKNNYLNNSTTIKTMFDELLSYYEENYKSSYPYYFVWVYFRGNNFDMYFTAYSDIPQISRIPVYEGDSRYDFFPTDSFYNRNPDSIYLHYEYSDGAIIKPINEVLDNSAFANNYLNTFIKVLTDHYYMYVYYYSNFDLKYISEDSSDKIIVNNYPFGNGTLTINNGDSFPKLQDLLELDIIHDSSLPSSSYTEINLNNYPYVVLSLNDYSVTDEFYSNMYVKGQYCVTPGYNYGLLSYDDVNSTRVQNICSQYYDQETMVRMYVTKDNLKNNSIYYIKAQDTSKENIIKVDTSVFTIHYIYEDDKDNPIININGKNYSIIPFDELPSTANGNTDEGFVPGLSCQVGDFNCTTSNYYRSDSNLFDENGNLSFNNLFSSPLDLLKDIWSAIVKVFELIYMLILLLPTPMQSFLFYSFMLCIILGIIKILL